MHLTPRGVDVVTSYIAGTVERVLAGENVSPAAAPWTLLLPGTEGDVVIAVQEALMAAGVEVPGGADGVYGNDTMIAVAEYQRRTGGLQMTGAVDMATARSLGVYEDPDAASETAAAPATTVAPTVPAVAQAAADGGSTEPAARGGAGLPRWPLLAASAIVALAVGVIGRRRYVVARRAARRWARVHPATSPRRSVADMRRAGELPDASSSGRIYDHQMEEPAAAR